VKRVTREMLALEVLREYRGHRVHRVRLELEAQLVPQV
jgi:hypothetical protein